MVNLSNSNHHPFQVPLRVVSKAMVKISAQVIGAGTGEANAEFEIFLKDL